MNSTSTIRHSEIAELAHQIWQDRGSPPDQDLAIWLEAEQQLIRQSLGVEALADPTVTKPSIVNPPHGAAMTDSSNATSLPTSHQVTDTSRMNADQTEAQKLIARAPRVPTKTNTAKHSVPESGKPLWSQAHSS